MEQWVIPNKAPVLSCISAYANVTWQRIHAAL